MEEKIYECKFCGVRGNFQKLKGHTCVPGMATEGSDDELLATLLLIAAYNELDAPTLDETAPEPITPEEAAALPTGEAFAGGESGSGGAERTIKMADTPTCPAENLPDPDLGSTDYGSADGSSSVGGGE